MIGYRKQVAYDDTIFLARIIRDPHNRASDALFIQSFMNNAG